MKTYFEYIFHPTYKDPALFMNMVLNEGYSEGKFLNFNIDNQNLLLECMNNSTRIFKTEQFQLLNELALQIKYIWKQEKNLKIFFLEGEDELHNRVLEIIKEWSDCCNLSFIKTLHKNDSDIRLSFNGLGYWSCIGTYALVVPKNEATINLQTNNGIDIYGDEFKRLTLHEFGHALGLVHEHQRPDVEIEWNTFYVNNYFQSYYNWNEEMIRHNLYDVFDKKEVNSSEKVDPLSIMAYHVPKEFILKGGEFPLNYKLSEIDKKHIGELYPQQKSDIILS